MSNEAKLLEALNNVFNALRSARVAAEECLRAVSTAISAQEASSPAATTSHMPQELGANPSLDEQPLRTQLLYAGKPIPAAGTAAAELVAAARAESARRKCEASKDTESE